MCGLVTQSPCGPLTGDKPQGLISPRAVAGGVTDHSWHMLNSGLGVLAGDGFYTLRCLWKGRHHWESEI